MYNTLYTLLSVQKPVFFFKQNEDLRLWSKVWSYSGVRKNEPKINCIIWLFPTFRINSLSTLCLAEMKDVWYIVRPNFILWHWFLRYCGQTEKWSQNHYPCPNSDLHCNPNSDPNSPVRYCLDMSMKTDFLEKNRVPNLEKWVPVVANIYHSLCLNHAREPCEYCHAIKHFSQVFT